MDLARPVRETSTSSTRCRHSAWPPTPLTKWFAGQSMGLVATRRDLMC